MFALVPAGLSVLFFYLAVSYDALFLTWLGIFMLLLAAGAAYLSHRNRVYDRLNDLSRFARMRDEHHNLLTTKH